ncbi:MAG: CoA transferase [Bacillaceae bacterium]|nr:CoA transferase [Bacillaceae bacterium]
MLQGIRVLDFSHYLPGPFASLRLADRGAEVIKVEPLTGDPARGMKIGGGSSLFDANNRHKKSLTLNLKSKEGQEIALGLAEKADVIIESFRPGVMKRLGMDYGLVKARNDQIIYLSLSGLGQQGSISHLGSHDLNYLALTGMLDQLRDHEGRPVHPTITLADLIGGMAASEAIVTALFQRERTGKGTYIDFSITDAVFSMMNSHTMIASLTGNNHGVPVLNGTFAHYHIYETKDGRYMSLGALEFKFWKNFCLAVKRPEWVAAYPDQLSADQPLYQKVKELFLSRTQEEWTKLGQEHDCCLFPVMTTEEATSNEYAKERKLIDYAGNKPYVSTLSFSHSSKRRQEYEIPLGAHTNELLMNLLQVDEKQIHEWREKGII